MMQNKSKINTTFSTKFDKVFSPTDKKSLGQKKKENNVF